MAKLTGWPADRGRAGMDVPERAVDAVLGVAVIGRQQGAIVVDLAR